MRVHIVRLSLPTQRLIAEGLQRRNELFKLLALAEDPRVKLTRIERGTDDLAANERAFFDALSGEGDFSIVCRQVGLDPLSGARTLQLLSLVGAVRIDRVMPEAGAADATGPSRNEDENVRECVLDHVKLLAIALPSLLSYPFRSHTISECTIFSRKAACSGRTFPGVSRIPWSAGRGPPADPARTG